MKLGEIMRADGKRLKHVDPMYTIAPHIMDKRYDAMNMITIDIPYEPVQNYLNSKRKEGTPMSHMAVLIAAYLRTCAKYPALNRFIMNKKVYARNHYAVSMVVLTPGTDGEETMSKMYFEPTDTIFDVNKWEEHSPQQILMQSPGQLIKIMIIQIIKDTRRNLK